MPLYKFKTSDRDGKVSELLVEGETQAEAARRLQHRGIIPLQFLGEGSLGGEAGGFSWGAKFDVTDFTDRLVPLLEADIPLERALGILGDTTENQGMSRAIADMRRGLHEGRRFSQLLKDRGRLFSPLYISLVEAGEEAGALPRVMAELQRFLNERKELRAFLLSASIYPLIVLSVSLGVIGVLLGVVVPKFAEMIVSSSDTVPAATAALIQVSEMLRAYWFLLPVGLALFILLLRAVRDGGPLRPAFDDLLLRLPGVRRLTLYANLARLCRTMSILMRGGAHLLDAVGIATRVLTNARLRESVGDLAADLRQGEKLSKSLRKSKFIPEFMLRMLAVGEEIGAVEKMLERVADRYERELKRIIQGLISILEPVLIVGLGLLVGAVVVSMFIGIMSMQSAF